MYPAASFAPYVSGRGKPVVEVNLDESGNSEVRLELGYITKEVLAFLCDPPRVYRFVYQVCQFTFQGKSGELLPPLLGVKGEVQALKKTMGH